jgi:hypothetical protein
MKKKAVLAKGHGGLVRHFGGSDLNSAWIIRAWIIKSRMTQLWVS